METLGATLTKRCIQNSQSPTHQCIEDAAPGRSRCPYHLEMNRKTAHRHDPTYEPKPKFRDYFKPDPMLAAVRERNRVALQFVENYHTGIEEGFVYVVTNPAWPGWVKIGSAVDPESRCKNYQTGSPYRDYILEGYGYSPLRKNTERAVHLFLGREVGEWFHLPVEEAVTLVKNFCQLSSANGKDSHATERETVRHSSCAEHAEVQRREALADAIDNAHLHDEFEF